MHQGGIRLTYGDFVKGRNFRQDEDPLSLSFNYSLIKFAKVPFTNANSRIQTRFAGQYSETSLPSTSQFSLTGPTKLRAFDINQFNADSGAYLSVDWIFSGPGFLDLQLGGEKLSDVLQPYVFVEAGYGDTKDSGRPIILPGAAATPEQPGTWAVLSDLGLGLRLSMRNNFRASLSYAYVTSYESDLGPITQESTRDLEERSKFYFDMQYSF